SCVSLLSLDAFMDHMADRQIAWGPRWRWLSQLLGDGQDGLARLQAPPGESLATAPLPPALLDNSFASVMLPQLQAPTGGDSVPQLPFALGALRVYGLPHGPVWCTARRHRTDEETTTGSVGYFDG